MNRATPRRAGRVGGALGWGLVAAGLGVVASPWVERVHRRLPKLHAIAQSLVQWSGLLALPAAAVAAWRRNRRLGAAAAGLGVAGLGGALWINGRPRRGSTPSDPSVSVAHFNLLYVNDRLAHDLPALGSAQADVLTFCELTPRHLRTLQTSELAEQYPFRVESPGPYATGTGLWSRFPLTPVDAPELEHHTVAADVATPLGPLRVVVIHTRSPIHHVGEWTEDLTELTEMPVPTDRPAVLIGDFNAAWGHPGFRRLVRAGWRDAHRELGRGLTNSWPTDRPWCPPFVRLDHALVNAVADVVDVTDVHVPGSDHSGIVVSVRRATG